MHPGRQTAACLKIRRGTAPKRWPPTLPHRSSQHAGRHWLPATSPGPTHLEQAQASLFVVGRGRLAGARCSPRRRRGRHSLILAGALWYHIQMFRIVERQACCLRKRRLRWQAGNSGVLPLPRRLPAASSLLLLSGMSRCLTYFGCKVFSPVSTWAAAGTSRLDAQGLWCLRARACPAHEAEPRRRKVENVAFGGSSSRAGDRHDIIP